MFCGGLFAGRIFDSHGPRWLLLSGSCLFILSFFIIPECKTYRQFFLAQGVCFGVSISLMYLPFCGSSNFSFFPSIACISHWFRRKRAWAMGIMYSGSSLGGVIWPILMSHIMNNPSLGFKWALRIAGFINVSSIKQKI
jgi:MFS transporter, MCT family, aspergillic acid transporter